MRRAAARLASALALVWFAATAAFFLHRALPGDPVAAYENPRVPAEQRARLRARYGLDRPLPAQYLSWLAAAATGDWGTSFARQRPVAEVVAGAVVPTAILAAGALAVQALLGTALGILAAARAGRPLDRVLGWISFGVYSLPTLWLALLLVGGLAHRAGWFPATGWRSAGGAGGGFGDVAFHLVLPALALGLPLAAGQARYVRLGLVDTLSEEFVRAARARGLSERRLLFAHALPAGLGPAVESLGLSAAALASGAVVTEVIFAWPGLGRLTYESVLARDYPVVLATVPLAALATILAGAATDLARAWLDPRQRSPR